MAKLVEAPPTFDLRRGMVHIVDEYGDRVMSLGDFVAATKIANQLCRQWVAESSQPERVAAFKRVEIG